VIEKERLMDYWQAFWNGYGCKEGKEKKGKKTTQGD